MEHNRIQKLLLSEYCEFSDTVLVESPFAETTRDGRGLREVALGLTPSRLVVAADILNKNSDFMCPPGLDPSIESFELVSVFPLECVALSIFRRRRRRTLKARLVDGRANYYELGGMERRGMFWTLWCERIQSLIAQKGNGSSLSETTAASSSSTSTLYLLSSGVEVDDTAKTSGTGACQRGQRDKAVCRVWAHYGGAGDGVPSWPKKDLYLGPSYDELGYGYYTPVPVRFAGASLDDLRYELNDESPNVRITKRGCYSWPVGQNSRNGQNHRSGGLCDVLFTRDRNLKPCHVNFTQGACVPPSYVVARAGINGTVGDRPKTADEKSAGNQQQCAVPDVPSAGRLVLGKYSGKTFANGNRNQSQQQQSVVSARRMVVAPKISRFGFGVRENCGSGLYLEPCNGGQDCNGALRPAYTLLDPYKLIEGGVSVWEGDVMSKGKGGGQGRRGLTTTTNRHPRRYGVATAAHFLHALGPWSVQPGERESVQGRRALSAVGVRRQAPDPELRLPVSRRQLAASVSATALETGRCGAMGAATRGRVVLFWTPEYWYRPRAATAAYKELRQHLRSLRDFRLDKEKANKRKFFCRRKRSMQSEGGDFAVAVAAATTAEERSTCILGRIFSSNGGSQARKRKKDRDCKEGSGTTSQLRRLLKMDLRVTAWDLDSTTISRQLTLIDRDLFLRIPSLEIEILVFQKSSRNAPNLGAWIAFSHRISCLTASEILAVKKLEPRTRLVARLINAADKCHGAGNFHSCRSILAGLQSPPIYRLRATWAYLRIHHATKYQAMERLCKIYKSPRTVKYRNAWLRAERNVTLPSMPYVGDLLARLLGINSAKSTSHPNSSSDSSRRCRTDKGQKNLQPTSDVNDKRRVESCKQGLARRILSAAILKLRSGKTNSSSSARGKNLSWTTREQEIARKAYDHWRNFVMESRLIAENDARLKSMDTRRKRVIQVASWLANCQRSAQNYVYPGHSLAWEFLLKARYKEDRENFFTSLKLEPPPA